MDKDLLQVFRKSSLSYQCEKGQYQTLDFLLVIAIGGGYMEYHQFTFLFLFNHQ